MAGFFRSKKGRISPWRAAAQRAAKRKPPFQMKTPERAEDRKKKRDAGGRNSPDPLPGAAVRTFSAGMNLFYFITGPL